MSDGRAVVVVVGLLAALLGAVLVVLGVLLLRDPVTISGETGARMDIARELVALVVLGGLLVLGGGGTAAALVRAQLRAATG